jgi:hypothetical protein
MLRRTFLKLTAAACLAVGSLMGEDERFAVEPEEDRVAEKIDGVIRSEMTFKWASYSCSGYWSSDDPIYWVPKE